MKVSAGTAAMIIAATDSCGQGLTQKDLTGVVIESHASQLESGKATPRLSR
ncbi:hypothetical protein PSCICJ_18070 [Pseudomonas cichorii]|nr:hypothetical protein PSCICJ_18070 [Pseudomonas cichorii]